MLNTDQTLVFHAYFMECEDVDMISTSFQNPSYKDIVRTRRKQEQSFL